MDILKKHYEKVVLGFLLLSFVVALIYLLQIMSSTHDTSSGNSAAAKNTLVIERERQQYKFQHKDENFSIADDKDVIWKERAGEGLIGYGRPGLAVPVKSLRCSQCKKIIPWAQLRQNDMRCPFETCAQDLQDPGEPEDYEKQLANFDSDGDGMPDRYEIRLGLNPNSADDADQDKDGDKFSNWFEYFCNTNPDDAKSVPSLDKMIYLSKIEPVKLPIRLSSITAANVADKNSYRIYITIQNRDTAMRVGASFNLLGTRYTIVDAVKRDATAQSTSFSQQKDDSTIWLQPEGKDKSERIEVRSAQDVFDRNNRKVVFRDVRTNKRRSNYTVGKTFTLKSGKEKNGILFELVKITDKSVDLKYTSDNKPVTVTLELIKENSVLHERLKKAYVRESAQSDSNLQSAEQVRPRQNRRSTRRR